MSLNAAAKHLAQHGRGNDSMLVHMSPKEVKSLQDLAMAHGGSLSVNPNTGLPEAGFLDSIMPMVVGAGITAATGGAAAPWMVGLGVGGLEALRTGDLGKGLMAGLGAYGGAGTMGGFMGAGAAPEALQAAQSNIDPAALEGMSKAQVASTIPGSSPFSLAAEGVKNTFNNPQGISAGLSNLAQGMGGTKSALGTAAAAAAPMIMGGGEEQGFQPAKNDEVPVYTFNPGAVNPTPQPNVPGYTDYTKPLSSQPRGMAENFGTPQTYYQPQYVFQGMKSIPKDQVQEEDNGLLGLGFLGLAGGGAVEQMSNAASVGANTGYPQSGISQGVYATPWQSPYATDVVGSAADVNVNPMTGEMRMAEGGSFVYDPKSQSYKALAVETPTITGQPKERLMAEMGASDGSASPTGGTPQGGGTTPAGYTSPFGQAVATLAYGLVPGAMMADQVMNGGQLGNSISAANTMGTGFFDAGLNAGYADSQTGAEGDVDAGIGSGAEIGDNGELAHGGEVRGISHLGSYSDGGRLLRGPGDGVSDDIPAVIGKNQPARLADGEFVVPARIVSELGNGSTEAGARKLYAMMDRIQAGRKKTMGNKKQFAKDSKADRHLPA